MAVNALDFFAPVPRPKGPQNEVRAVRRRKLGKAVNAAMPSDPITGLHVIRVCVLSEPSVLGLLGREESLLDQSVFVEPLRRCAMRLRHNTILQLFCGYRRFDAQRSHLHFGSTRDELNNSRLRLKQSHADSDTALQTQEKAGGPYQNLGEVFINFEVLTGGNLLKTMVGATGLEPVTSCV